MTTVTREQAMHSHFEIVEAELKKILKTDNFVDFYSPNQNNQKVCGRVINISTEEPKIKEGTIGLFNSSFDDNDCRLRLNLSEAKDFSLFEGEIIVAEGFMDTKKFNVNRIWKPQPA